MPTLVMQQCKCVILTSLYFGLQWFNLKNVHLFFIFVIFHIWVSFLLWYSNIIISVTVPVCRGRENGLHLHNIYSSGIKSRLVFLQRMILSFVPLIRRRYKRTRCTSRLRSTQKKKEKKSRLRILNCRRTGKKVSQTGAPLCFAFL